MKSFCVIEIYTAAENRMVGKCISDLYRVTATYNSGAAFNAGTPAAKSLDLLE